MSLFLMANRVVAGDYLTDFTMMPRSFTGLHVFFRMGGGVAGDVGPADVTVKSGFEFSEQGSCTMLGLRAPTNTSVVANSLKLLHTDETS